MRSGTTPVTLAVGFGKAYDYMQIRNIDAELERTKRDCIQHS